MPKREVPVARHPQIYRVVQESNGRVTNTNTYRVRKRVKVNGRWSTRVFTFNDFDEAKRCARATVTSANFTVKSSEKFEDIFEKLMAHKKTERKLSAGTLQGYWVRARHLQFFQGLLISEITAQTVDRWIDLLMDPKYQALQQATRVNYRHEYGLLTALFKFYREFIDERFVSPIFSRHRLRTCSRPKKTETIRFLSEDEEEKFLALLSKKPIIRDLALFQLHTGVRVGEAAALEFRSVSFSKKEVAIRQHLYWERMKNATIDLKPGTKTGPDRNVFLTPECEAMLCRRLAEAKSEKVFEHKGGWLPYRSIQAAYDRAFKELGLPHRGTHTLRHTFAVRFLDQTKDIHALQKILGHANLKDTQIYAKYSNESVRQSFQLFRGGQAPEKNPSVPKLVPNF